MEVLLFHLQNGSSQSSVLLHDLFLEARSSSPFLVQLNEKSRRVLFSVCFAAHLLTWLSERCLDEQKRSFCLECRTEQHLFFEKRLINNNSYTHI